jgi:hypothetical protein
MGIFLQRSTKLFYNISQPIGGIYQLSNTVRFDNKAKVAAITNYGSPWGCRETIEVQSSIPSSFDLTPA